MLQGGSQGSPPVHTICKLPSRTRMPPKSPLTPEDFHLAVHRLRESEGDATPEAPVNTSLALLSASDICGWAQHVLRVLSEYQLDLDYEAGGEVRDELIEPIIVKRGVKKATLLGEMRGSGRMVKELLDWFRPSSCPWAIIILLIVFIDRGKHKRKDLLSALLELVDTPQDSSWGNPHFSNRDVLSVLKIAFDAKVQPATQALHGKVCRTTQVTDAGVQCSLFKPERNRRRIVWPPAAGCLCPLYLPHQVCVSKSGTNALL